LKVKICGIKTHEAAMCAVESGADAVGFVFAESKRRISPEDAREIIQALPSGVWKVGVFVNEEAETIREIAEITGLTHIQLHGQEQPEHFAEIKLPIIKSIPVSGRMDLERSQSIMAEFLLLDSPPGKYVGGNGVRFDWSLARSESLFKKNIILAGGLNPQNVAEAIRMTEPYMVDVSSGVESDGVKDFAKIREFIANAKRTGEEG
jgi:phosphoribosylanthranilate isomerase